MNDCTNEYYQLYHKDFFQDGVQILCTLTNLRGFFIHNSVFFLIESVDGKYNLETDRKISGQAISSVRYLR